MYSHIKDTIFTGATGRELRRLSPAVRELQFFLCAGPTTDRFGIWIFEAEIAGAVLGRTAASIQECLATLAALRFCDYDPSTQYLWVIEMAHHQFDTPLKLVDNRCTLAKRWYKAMQPNPFLGDWFDRYATDFHLEKDPHAVERRAPNGMARLAEPLPQAPSEPHVLSAMEGEGVIGESERKEGEPDPLGLVPLSTDELDAAFERVWAVHPHAVERKAARAAFGVIHPTSALVAEMLEAIARQKQSAKWRKGFVPKLANWLEKQCWLDRLDETPVVTERTARAVSAAEDFVRRHKA